MELREAQNIVKTLATGVDPTTGEAFAEDSTYNEPEIIRALFTVHEFVRRARKPKMSADERRRENLANGRPGNFGMPWTEDIRSWVAEGFREGRALEDMATSLERTPGAIRAELIRQGLLPPDFE